MAIELKGLVIGCRPGVPQSALRGALTAGMGIAEGGFDLEPLTTSSGLGLAAGPERSWFAAHPKRSLAGAHPWELAHQAQMNGRGLAAAGVEIIEPDFLQDWMEGPMKDRSAALGSRSSNDVCAFEDQKKNLPRHPEFAWHLRDDFSQLRSAAKKAKEGSPNAKVRIAHLDTGYDPDHLTFPSNVDLALQENFVDADRRGDARDLGADGILKQPGHGTGTLSILAGRRFQFQNNGYRFDAPLGAAPDAIIVPVRTGNSVVQIRTSQVAKAIDYVVGLCRQESSRVHVISMSMGGVASAAWADAVNRAYDAGIVFVAAAGNNFSGAPTRFIIYPARFRRVLAACGVMADGMPYFDLPLGTMQGNWGPDGKMDTALAAFTPNVSWAKYKCGGIVDMDGEGTSSATPQVAAAAALYIQRHAQKLLGAEYAERWRLAEAVRQALLESAKSNGVRAVREKLGRGVLQASDALLLQPPSPSSLRKAEPDRATFAFLRGLGILHAAEPAQEEMLRLEATQLALRPFPGEKENAFERALPNPDAPPERVPAEHVGQFMELIEQHPQASPQLKRWAQARLTAGPSRGRKTMSSQVDVLERPTRDTSENVQIEKAPPPPLQKAAHVAFKPPKPTLRRLRGYAIDPSLSGSLATSTISEMVFEVPWEDLEKRESNRSYPIGEYLEIIDVDPSAGCVYEPLDLEDDWIVAEDGLSPSEGTPQFHQQMVYAVCSLTIRNFEYALGRKVLWRHGPPPAGKDDKDDSVYIQRLRVYPHGLQEANAYYSPNKIALLFGYFNADPLNPGDHMPGARVFTCLSHDVIAHETTHAILDGMHREFLAPSNLDVHAFHEAFADIVALFQHFTFKDMLREQIAATRGEIRSQESLLGQLAGQFGRAIGGRGALRDAIGKMQDGRWVPHTPDPREYQETTECHARGAILVAAVFDAFLSIYERRTRDLLRLATGGTGLLQPGAVHPDLVGRLAAEAAKSAKHVLTMCVRALDYCPPTDITFGEYLRALITADHELVPEDDLNYRVAFMEAFRKRGIFPPDVRTFSEESLMWRGPAQGAQNVSEAFTELFQQVLLSRDLQEHIYATSREVIFKAQRRLRGELQVAMKTHFQNDPNGPSDAACLGLNPKKSFEVRTARLAHRPRPDGQLEPQLIVSLLQTQQIPVSSDDPDGPTMPFVGGCTLLADRSGDLKYCIRKSASSKSRQGEQQRMALAGLNSLRATYLGAAAMDGEKEPFAMMHRSLSRTTS